MYMFVCLFVCVNRVSALPIATRRGRQIPKTLELQMIVSSYVGVGDGTESPATTVRFLSH